MSFYSLRERCQHVHENGINLPPSRYYDHGDISYNSNTDGKRIFQHILITGYKQPYQLTRSNNLRDSFIRVDEGHGFRSPIVNISPNNIIPNPVTNDRALFPSNVNIPLLPVLKHFDETNRQDEIYISLINDILDEYGEEESPHRHDAKFSQSMLGTTESNSRNVSLLTCAYPGSNEITSQLNHDKYDVCFHNLKPVEVPHNLLDNEWETTPFVIKELAWIVEESLILLPSTIDVCNTTHIQLSLPIVLDFAWRHGSLQLRKLMWNTYTTKQCELRETLYNGSGVNRTIIDGMELLKNYDINENDPKFVSLRKECNGALHFLGFRRSSSIGKELDNVRGKKLREALEEVGEDSDITRTTNTRRLKEKRKNKFLYANLQSTLEGNMTDAELAVQVPPCLTPLEEELAWLVEESLILLPKGIVLNTNSLSTLSNHAVTETVISSGLVTSSNEIDWEYVEQNASANLRDALDRIGGTARRPLQRLVRSYDKEVHDAFRMRRDTLAVLLLVRGYRREETRLSLPSPELLVHTGLMKVWSVRLLRRKQRTDCNLLSQGTKKTSDQEMITKRRRLTRRKTEVVKNCSILTTEEEEIAWMREEYEYETGIKCYDWEYIEAHASAHLRKRLKEKKCLLSMYPSIPGVSRLRTMVRLAIPSVNDAFERKRANVRYHLCQNGFRRALGNKNLPVVPDAPPLVSTTDFPIVRKNGTHVIDIENARPRLCQYGACLDDDDCGS